MVSLIDISPALSPSIAVFPGDSPLTREVLLDLRNDDNLTLSTLRSTVHIGSHLDAPSHYDCDGATIDQVDLQRDGADIWLSAPGAIRGRIEARQPAPGMQQPGKIDATL